jgi:transposase
VKLTEEERDELLVLLRGGKVGARKIRRAQILLLSDEGQTDAAIARSLHCGKATVERTRQRFVEGSLPRALNDDPRPGARRKLDGHQEALVLALASSPAPPGAARWTLRLLADRLVELEIVESISRETVSQVLKRGRSSLG